MKVIYVKEMPKTKEENILYISKEYGVSIHLCPCGCKNEVVIPFHQIGIHNWKMETNNELVTFSPSISNAYLDCKSHYWIRDNKIVWC